MIGAIVLQINLPLALANINRLNMILKVNPRLMKLKLNRFRANSLFRLVILILKSAPLRKNSKNV